MGIQSVSKMKKMIDDLEANKNDSTSYKALEHKGNPNGIQLDVTAISQCAWDINISVFEKFKIPKFLKTCLEDFETYYIN